MAQRKIIAISDLHLGCERCNRSELNNFLDSLQDDKDLTDLVLLGDIVDMWRRDASGVFLESRDTLDKIFDLKRNVDIHYVAGNHDYHVLYLKNRDFFRYPLEFKKELTLNDGPFTYRFIHGYEREYAEFMYPLMEVLCRAMSDDEGSFRDVIWMLYKKFRKDFPSIPKSASTPDEQQVIDAAEYMRKDVKDRLEGKLQEIRSRAADERMRNPQEILIFGHTHDAYNDKAKRRVNTGAWVSDAERPNTYVVISGGEAKLYQFGHEEEIY